MTYGVHDGPGRGRYPWRRRDIPRRYADYEPVPRRWPPPEPWLRTAQLNLVGWSALLGACLGAAGLGLAAARLTPLPPRARLKFAVAPVVALVVALVVADRRRWAAIQARTSAREQDFGDRAEE